MHKLGAKRRRHLLVLRAGFGEIAIGRKATPDRVQRTNAAPVGCFARDAKRKALNLAGSAFRMDGGVTNPTTRPVAIAQLVSAKAVRADCSVDFT